MEKQFILRKNNHTCFEIKEENLQRIEIPQLHHESTRVIEVIPSGYEDTRWIEKSKSIKARDNYTCQLCHAFNPSLGEFVFVKQGNYETIHHYYWTGISKYEIQLTNMMLTINFDFSPFYHLAMPRLNVHHKIYYRNRKLWDYEDDCLVTLCESCHHFVHSLNDISIPIVEKYPNGEKKLIGTTKPKPYHPVLDHTDLGTFQPLALVKENRWGNGLQGEDLNKFELAKNEGKKWFDYQEVLDNHIVHISYFTSYDPRVNHHSSKETKSIAEFIIRDFIENILGFRQKEKTL